MLLVGVRPIAFELFYCSCIVPFPSCFYSLFFSVFTLSFLFSSTSLLSLPPSSFCVEHCVFPVECFQTQCSAFLMDLDVEDERQLGQYLSKVPKAILSSQSFSCPRCSHSASNTVWPPLFYNYVPSRTNLWFQLLTTGRRFSYC